MVRTQGIWLVLRSDGGVDRMTKRLPDLAHDEHAVKVSVSVDTRALRPPVIEASIVIEDWRQGLDVSDVDLRQLTITETEAGAIRRMRREAMVGQMRSLGYTVLPPEEEPPDASDGQPGAPRS